MKPFHLLLALAACGDNLDDTLSAQTVSGVSVLSHDCAQGPASLDTYAPAAGTVQAVGVYNALNNDAPWFDEPACSDALSNCPLDDTWSACLAAAGCDPTPKPHPATVNLDGIGISTLVLASYEPTNWTISPRHGGRLERVILTGYYANTADVPEGVTVETADLGEAYDFLTDGDLALSCADVDHAPYCGSSDDWWYEERDQRAQQDRAFVDAVEAYTQAKLGSFSGCYALSEITLGAD